MKGRVNEDSVRAVRRLFVVIPMEEEVVLCIC